MDERHIYIYGEIGWEANAKSVQDQINAPGEFENLIVHMSSPGGGVFEGWTIGNIIKNLGKNTTCQIEGLCASIATFIALSCDRVEMADTGRFMIHNPMTFTEGGSEDMEQAAEQLQKIKDDLISTYNRKTGLKTDELSDMMNKETWLNPEEAKELKFIDAIIEPVKAVAKFDIKNKTKTMEKVDLTILDKIIEKARKILTPIDAKNVTVMLADGSSIWIDSEDGEFEGKNVFTVDEAGEPTEMPPEDGTYALEDGRSITIEAGVVASVQEAEPSEVDLLKDQVAKLEEEISASQAEKEKVEKEKEETNKSVSQLILEVENLKKMTAGDNKPLKKPINQPVNKFEKSTETAHPLDGFAASLKRTK